MTAEFHSTFGIGPSDDPITNVNAAGVTLAAIRDLSTRMEEAHNELDDLAAELEERDACIESQAERIDENEAENERLCERNKQFAKGLEGLKRKRSPSEL